MIGTKELQAYIDNLLNCGHFKDYAPNGLQIEGCGTVHSICTAVTASLKTIETAAQHQASALLVHHGYFWRGEEPNIVGVKKSRIARLLHHDINLFAYHLPLDCHPELGNNACLGRLFNLQDISAHSVNEVPNLLWSGKLSRSCTAAEMEIFLAEKLQRQPFHLAGGPPMIKKIAWCTGGAQDYIEEAQALGVDAYLSGEVSERTYYQAEELGIHYFACGHHATERYGIQALGDHLAKKFDLAHVFIDSDNGV